MMKPKTWLVFNEALEEGLSFALNRVVETERGKMTEEEWREVVLEKMRQEVLNAVCDKFDFE